VGESFPASPLQAMPPSAEAANQRNPRYRLFEKTSFIRACTEKSAETLSSITNRPVFDEIIRYSGLCGFLPIECASRQHQQKCNNEVLLRRLCDDVGVHVTQQCSIKKLKQVCGVAFLFPGQAWEMSATEDTDNFINCGLRAIPKLRSTEAGPLLRVSSFDLTPNETRHLTHLVEGLENNPDTYQPLPDAPHIDDEHEFYLQLQAPLLVQFGKLSVQFGFLDLYITWEAGELILCVGVSLCEVVQEAFQKRCAVLYPVDHRDGINLHGPLGGIWLPGFDFGFSWFDTWHDARRILPILRSLVSEGQVRCLVAFPIKAAIA